MFFFCLVFAMHLYASVICALWSPAGKGLTSWLSFVTFSCEFVTSHWYPGQVWYLIVSIPDLCTLTYVGPVEQSVVSSIADTGIVSSIRAQYLCGG